jgi:hypothetical protein
MITQTACTVFKSNMLKGLENFNAGTAYTYKIALYNALADLGDGTTAYTSSNEVTGSGYTAGGKVLAPTTILSNTEDNTAYLSFANVNWTPANFTCRGALVYNSTTNAAVFVLNFGSDKTATTSFTVQFPTANSTNAILRIS